MLCVKCGGSDLSRGKSDLVDLSNGPLCKTCYRRAYEAAYYAKNPDKRNDVTVNKRMKKYVEKNRNLINLRKRLRYTESKLEELSDKDKIAHWQAKKELITQQLERLVGS